MSDIKIAHVARLDDLTLCEPHRLEDHLAAVACLSACFARPFDSEDWARLAGQWHDLGKYRPKFQQYIRCVTGFEAENAHIESSGRVDHSTAGAVHAVNELGEAAGRLLAYLIAGHHAGLPDWNGDNSGLFQRLMAAREAGFLEEALNQTPPEAILRGARPESRPKGDAADFHLWIRMLFSCLVDADFLDTEAYMRSDRSDVRATYSSIDDLLSRFTVYATSLAENASPTLVNQIRSDVLRQCIERAGEKSASGLYSLTVPTGGGKTLSSLAFALHHAVKYRKRRVIYAIPYLSIIEQTADTFRKIFGENVVEHHSNLDPDKETARSRLATENWDAPLIVTTNVQLFESLFAARTSRCRKLHNLVDSVVILDEAQLLPPEFLEPCLAAIRTLSNYYRVTFVLCTATQPAFQSREINGKPFLGLPDVRELMQGGPFVQSPDDLFHVLDRTTVHWPESALPTSWDDLSQRVLQHEQALVILNRKLHASELTKRLPGAIYLSTNLCGAHRAVLLDEIRSRLAMNRDRAKVGLPVHPLHVVSTQLIEAGVDVDFPVVYRALGGLDSIAQAAGRCNREGQLLHGEGKSKGEVFIFIPPEPAPSGLLLKGEQATKELLAINPCPELSPALFERYFRLWFASINSLDKEGILALLQPGKGLEFSFRTAAEKFRLIPDEGVPIIVLLGESKKWISMLKSKGTDRWLMRKLQRYSVNVHKDCLRRLIERSDVNEVLPGIYVQTNELLYDDVFGFIGCADSVVLSAEKLCL